MATRSLTRTGPSPPFGVDVRVAPKHSATGTCNKMLVRSRHPWVRSVGRVATVNMSRVDHIKGATNRATGSWQEKEGLHTRPREQVQRAPPAHGVRAPDGLDGEALECGHCLAPPLRMALVRGASVHPARAVDAHQQRAEACSDLCPHTETDALLWLCRMDKHMTIQLCGLRLLGPCACIVCVCG